jgi:MYXO-CTERM domain-containing protein
LKKKGVTCTRADECATGHCVDGTCCDLACGGQCEACDVKGSEGTCTPVVGKPHTPRSTCDSKADNDCAKAQCDGKARDKCNGFVNAGTVSCGVDSCTTDKRFQKKGTCDGAGGCARPDPKPCTPYVCDATAPSGCKTACVTDADCAESFKCDAGVCVQGAHCSDDQLSSIDKSGTSKLCTPYLCNSDGKCATSCGSSADCVAGSVCDEDVKACIVVQNGAADETSGGCGCETGPGDTSHPKTFAGMLAALFALAAVRKRPRRGRTPRA